MLAFIAAGPLENLLAAHGHRLIEHVADAARFNPKLRRALSGVWGENRMPEAVTARLRFITRDEPPF